MVSARWWARFWYYSLFKSASHARVFVQLPSSSISWAYFSTIRFDSRRQGNCIVCQAASSTCGSRLRQADAHSLVSSAARGAKIHGSRISRFHLSFLSAFAGLSFPPSLSLIFRPSPRLIYYSNAPLITDFGDNIITYDVILNFPRSKSPAYLSCNHSSLDNAGQLHLPV